MLPRGDVAAQWSGVYVTMNRKGEIAMNGVTHRRLGGAEVFHVMFDRVNSRIGLLYCRAEKLCFSVGAFKWSGEAMPRPHRWVERAA